MEKHIDKLRLAWQCYLTTYPSESRYALSYKAIRYPHRVYGNTATLKPLTYEYTCWGYFLECLMACEAIDPSHQWIGYGDNIVQWVQRGDDLVRPPTVLFLRELGLPEPLCDPRLFMLGSGMLKAKHAMEQLWWPLTPEPEAIPKRLKPKAIEEIILLPEIDSASNADRDAQETLKSIDDIVNTLIDKTPLESPTEASIDEVPTSKPFTYRQLHIY